MVGKSTLGRSLTGNRRYANTPKIRIAAMISVVVMGRRINNCVFILRSALDVDFGARSQAQLAVGHYALSWLQPGSNHRVLAHIPADFHGLLLGREVLLNYVDVRSALAGLQRGRRHHNGVRL